MTPRLDERTRDAQSSRRGWAIRIAWFIGLWLAGVAVVGTVAWLLRLWIVP